MTQYKRTHKKLQNTLTKLCKRCDAKIEMGGCPFANKHECPFCNIEVAETVLKDYSESDLLRIPVHFFIRGLQAHKFSGELQKIRVVQI